MFYSSGDWSGMRARGKYSIVDNGFRASCRMLSSLDRAHCPSSIGTGSDVFVLPLIVPGLTARSSG